MPPKSSQKTKQIEQYDHKGSCRLNNPPIGLVDAQTEPEEGATTYAYDPHLDPQLVWAGKVEHTSFAVPKVSLHVHERIDPKTIIRAVRSSTADQRQASLFEFSAENPPLREAVEFYRHRHKWSNRLVTGDSLLVMNSLLQKENMAGKVQMIYIDPPYGIRYGSNFQPFVNKRDVKDGKDEDLTSEPEMIKAFRDTWELGIHSYLTYLRDRLLLARELLAESGSVFVQISDENVHHVREIMDEVFGAGNFQAQINYRSMSPLGHAGMSKVYDYILWYNKNRDCAKYHPIFVEQKIENESEFAYMDTGDGKYQKLTRDQTINLDKNLRKKIFKRSDLHSSGYGITCDYEINFEGNTFQCGKKSWRTHKDGMMNLIKNNRLFVLGKNIYFKQYYSDFPLINLENSWSDTAAGYSDTKKYVVETNPKVIQRCLLMTTDPGDLVLDPTCGSGTTAYVAEKWGRRWITCDTSRVATTLAKQRLMTAVFDYYDLAHPEEGVGSGFVYKTVPHVTLKSIANKESPVTETLYDQPETDKTKVRVTGPFTVEAVPAPTVEPLTGDTAAPLPADGSASRTGESVRQDEWRTELLATGIRGKGGQRIAFARLEPLGGTRWLHASGETKDSTPKQIAVSFGPEHAALDSKQVERAITEARNLVPRPEILVFAAFQFDPEAAKDIDETNWPGVTLLKAQMNADLQTADLKKKSAGNESFWLIGQPDISIEYLTDGKVRVTVNGFDYYDTRTGEVVSGGPEKIAMWMLDTDYDDRSLYPRQVFFPMAGAKDGWAKLAKSLKAEIDDEKIEAYRGTVSLPFTPGDNHRIAVRIVDDRGIECPVNRYLDGAGA